MPLPTLGPTLTSAGISIPTYADILADFQEQMQTIFGSDIYISPDSQDGQQLAIIAAAVYDCDLIAVAIYNAFSPATAQGAALSSQVKINGLRRQPASLSTAVGLVTGVVGTIITNGVVQDDAGNKWNLPATVTIPDAGEISVTVTSQVLGAIVAPAGTINTIITATRGWQLFTSTADAAVGDPVETDAELRQRQAVSTAVSSKTPVDGLYGALANLPGVVRLQIYENDTNSTDGNGIPAHSISLVIEGGDIGTIGETVALKKTPGCGTYGSETVTYINPLTGLETEINFYVLANETIKVEIDITALTGYNSNIGDAIKAAVAAFINDLGIGEDVQWGRLWGPAYLGGIADGQTYEITRLEIYTGSDPPATDDIVIPFNEAAACDAATDIELQVF